ncbi:MAG: DEAD/DEAH box helicase, partial [Thermodesulfobacteriota bacterium]
MENEDSDKAYARGDAPRFLTKVAFDALALAPEVKAGLADAGFTHCSPIQSLVIPVALSGRDVAGQAQTGTGKTAAFLAPMLTRLLALGPDKRKQPCALIMAPTRELAIQIYEDATVIGGRTGFSFLAVVGGMDYRGQAEALKAGVDVVIGTPGRLIDYQKQGIFQADGIRIVVIDEADRLLDLGFAKDMRFILRKLPPFTKRQSMLFSATLSYRVMELTYEFMNLPEFIDVVPEEVTVSGIRQELYHVGLDEKLPLLLGLLKREPWTRALVFVNTRSGVDWLTHKLSGNGIPAGGITGDLPQKQRLKLMERFKNGELKLLVATDVASRGIHIEDVSHVINYDIPQDAENYVHRIGRTARAGKTGCAVTLACETYVYYLEAVEELIGQKIPVVWPEAEWSVPDQAGPLPRRRDGSRGGSRERSGEKGK